MREFRDLCVSEDRYGHFEVDMSFCGRLCASGRVYALFGLIEREKRSWVGAFRVVGCSP